MKANRSKIGRLPFEVRNEACLKLHDGATSAAVRDWLNSRAEVGALGLGPINDHNMSDWLRGGYEDWRKLYAKTDRVARLAEASEMIASRAGGSATSVLSNVIASALADIVEASESETLDPELVEKLSISCSALGRLENDRNRTALAREQLDLANKKFAAMQAKLDEAKKLCDPEASPLTDEERNAKYKEIFGI